jgi:tetratricopeptide (TPR) repeat protein
LGPRYIYDLNDALEVEGRLEKRLQLLDPLETRLKRTGDEYIYHQHHGYNYAAVLSKLGAIHQAMGHMEEALKYFEKRSLLGEELYAANPKNINLLEGLGISYYKLAMIYKAMSNDQKGKEKFAQ